MDSKSPIETATEVMALPEGKDIFTNAHPLWSFAGGRGVYGGSTVAQCLMAAQNTISGECVAHSIHSIFLSPADPSLPIEYHVERTRDGRGFSTRAVSAKQSTGITVCMAIVNFARVWNSSHMPVGLEHEKKMPQDLVLPDQAAMDGMGEDGPFEIRRAEILNRRSNDVSETQIRYWIRAKGTIGKDAGTQTHLAALAYMSDAYFLGAIFQVHDGPLNPLRVRIAFGASVTHTVYFHNPAAVRADQWLCSERESPWAGNERGLAIQRIWSMEGNLIATCVQEGVMRVQANSKKGRL